MHVFQQLKDNDLVGDGILRTSTDYNLGTRRFFVPWHLRVLDDISSLIRTPRFVFRSADDRELPNAQFVYSVMLYALYKKKLLMDDVRYAQQL